MKSRTEQAGRRGGAKTAAHLFAKRGRTLKEWPWVNEPCDEEGGESHRQEQVTGN